METFLCDGADEALSVGIRIRCPPRGLHDADTTLAQQLPYRAAPLRVSIANQYAMRAQQPVIRHRQRTTDLPHEQLVGMRREPEYAHASRR